MGRAGAWQPELRGALKRLRNYPLPGKTGFGIGPTGCRSWVKKLENLSFSANLDHFKGTSRSALKGALGTSVGSESHISEHSSPVNTTSHEGAVCRGEAAKQMICCILNYISCPLTKCKIGPSNLVKSARH